MPQGDWKTLTCEKCGRIIQGTSPNYVTAGFHKHEAWHKRIETLNQIEMNKELIKNKLIAQKNNKHYIEFENRYGEKQTLTIEKTKCKCNTGSEPSAKCL